MVGQEPDQALPNLLPEPSALLQQALVWAQLAAGPSAPLREPLGLLGLQLAAAPSEIASPGARFLAQLPSRPQRAGGRHLGPSCQGRAGPEPGFDGASRPSSTSDRARFPFGGGSESKASGGACRRQGQLLRGCSGKHGQKNLPGCHPLERPRSCSVRVSVSAVISSGSGVLARREISL